MKRRLVALALAGMMSMSVAGCGNTDEKEGKSSVPESAKGEYVLKLCTEQTDGDPIDEGCDKWAELVKEATDGAVTIEVYPSSQLGAKADLIEMAMMGQNICTIADGSYLMDYVSDFGVVMGVLGLHLPGP